MYKPERHFMRRLQELDKNLGCEFNRNTQRFNVTFKRATGQPVPIIQVNSENGGFRQPDQRELNILGESDLQRIGMKDRLNKASKYMFDYREKKAKEAKLNLKDMTKDGKHQLKRAVGRIVSGKCNTSTFRKIEDKPKGKVF